MKKMSNMDPLKPGGELRCSRIWPQKNWIAEIKWKKKNEIYHFVRTALKSIRKILETEALNYP